MKTHILLAGVAVWGMVGIGCGTPPTRVTSVTTSRWNQMVQEADARFFLASRATGSRLENRPLPPAEQRQEILVRWTGSTVDTVRLEYRQPGLPNRITQQTVPVGSQNAHVFVVAADDYRAGGPVSAWRVTLLQADHPVAQKHSALWQ